MKQILLGEAHDRKSIGVHRLGLQVSTKFQLVSKVVPSIYTFNYCQAFLFMAENKLLNSIQFILLVRKVRFHFLQCSLQSSHRTRPCRIYLLLKHFLITQSQNYATFTLYKTCQGFLLISQYCLHRSSTGLDQQGLPLFPLRFKRPFSLCRTIVF